MSPTTTFDIRYTNPIAHDTDLGHHPGRLPERRREHPRQRYRLVRAPTRGGADSYCIFTPNDFNYALRVTIVDQQPLPGDGPLFAVTFDSCSGVSVPPASGFGCIVEACAGAGGGIAGCTCEVTAPWTPRLGEGPLPSGPRLRCHRTRVIGGLMSSRSSDPTSFRAWCNV